MKMNRMTNTQYFHCANHMIEMAGPEKSLDITGPELAAIFTELVDVPISNTTATKIAREYDIHLKGSKTKPNGYARDEDLENMILNLSTMIARQGEQLHQLQGDMEKVVKVLDQYR